MSEADIRVFEPVGPTTVRASNGIQISNTVELFEREATLFECPEGGEVAVSNGAQSGSVGGGITGGGIFGLLTVINATDCGFEDIIVSGNYEHVIDDFEGEQGIGSSRVDIRSRSDESLRTTITFLSIQLGTNNNEVVSQFWSGGPLVTQFNGFLLESSVILHNNGRNNSTSDAIVDTTSIRASRVVSEAFDGEVSIRSVEPINQIDSIVPGEPVAGRFTVTSDVFQWTIDADGGDPAGFLFTQDDLIYWILLVRMLVSDR